MQCTAKESGRQTVVIVHGNLDSPRAAADFRDFLTGILAAGKRRITIDLSHVESIDSNGIGKLLFFYKKLQESGGEMRVSSLKGGTEEIFRTLMLDRLFGIEDQAGGSYGENHFDGRRFGNHASGHCHDAGKGRV